MIPKRIIQTDRSLDLPVLARAATSSVRLHNPDFEYLFFDDQQVENFVATEFPQYVSVFSGFRVPIQRIDFFRYLAVFKLGGFYFDTDVLFAAGLSELLDCECVFPFERLTWTDYFWEEYGIDWEIGNYAFGATAGHPFIRAVIENCVRGASDPCWAGAPTRALPKILRQDLYVIYTTGPGMVTRTLVEHPDVSQDVTILFPEDVCDKRSSWNLFGKYAVHLGGGSWRVRHGDWRRRYHDFFAKRNEERAIKRGRVIGARRIFGGGACTL